jgi:predicted enzyme related to lactoylglutathione lyase
MGKNPVVYWELASHDARASVDFLRQVFEWDFELDEMTGIYEIPADSAENAFSGGGVFTLRKAKLPFLTLYIRVQDIDAKAKRIEDLGGYVVEAPFDLPSGSRICLFNEPSGVTLAMIQKPASRASG